MTSAERRASEPAAVASEHGLNQALSKAQVVMIGLGLAVAVLMDATLIRCVLGPALMHVAGRWNWWPTARPR